MGRLLRTSRANRDFVEIWSYIAKDNPSAAENLLDSIERTCNRLAQFPDMGQSCKCLGQSVRCFTVGNYVVFYRAIKDGIEVLRVVSGSRDIRAIFDNGS
jgi:toxin ParE1/3/4